MLKKQKLFQIILFYYEKYIEGAFKALGISIIDL